MSILKWKVKDGETFFEWPEGSIVELQKDEAIEHLDKLELVRDADGVAYTIPPEEQRVEFVLRKSLANKLIAAGYEKCGEVAELSDEELLAIDGVGESSFKGVREILGGGDPLPEDPDSEPDESEIKIVEFEVE